MLALLGSLKRSAPILWYADSSGNSSTALAGTGMTQGDDGGGLKYASFTGSGNINVTSTLNYGTNDFCIEAFINHTAFTNGDGTSATTLTCNQYYYDHGTNEFPGQYLQGSLGYADGVLTMNRAQTTVKPTLISYSLNTWHHIAFTRQTGVVRMFSDGVALQNGVTTANLSYTGLKIGTYGGGNLHFVGKMVGFRIVLGNAVYTSNFTTPNTLPTNITGTKLLLNMQAIAAPVV
jgi:hypothetical protein